MTATEAIQQQKKTYVREPQFRCTECNYKNPLIGGAANHSKVTGHFVTDAPEILDND